MSSSPFQDISNTVSATYQNLFANPVKTVAEKATGLASTLKSKVLTGFGFSSSVIFLVLGLVYIGLAYKYGLGGGCSTPFEQYANSVGIIYIILAVALFYPTLVDNVPFLNLLLVVVPVVLFGLQLGGYIILFRDSGIECRGQNSSTRSLWLGLTVLSVLGTAGLGAVPLAAAVVKA